MGDLRAAVAQAQRDVSGARPGSDDRCAVELELAATADGPTLATLLATPGVRSAEAVAGGARLVVDDRESVPTVVAALTGRRVRVYAVVPRPPTLEDVYFVKRKLYPNVDFYSGLIYEAMGFQVEMFPVLFAIPRTVGWCAQWEEMVKDPEQKIARPRQVYTGNKRRDYIAMDKRVGK